MELFLPALLLLFVGWLVKYRKWTWLIAGYNTASKSQKETYDIEKLTRHVGNLIFILAGIFVIMGLANLIMRDSLESIVRIGTVVFIATAVLGLVYINTGNRLKKE